MAATLITYADGVVTPFLDGIMQELYTSGGGIITGGTITISGASTLHITQAHGALCGREFSIDDGDYSVQLSSSGTKLGRIYLHMDLSNTANPLEVLIETGSSLTPVQQDADVNETNGVYEINLATFDVDESTISNLASVAPTIKTLAERTLQTVSDCVNSTDPQDIAGAAAVSMLNSKLSSIGAFKEIKTLTNGNPVVLDNAIDDYTFIYVLLVYGNDAYYLQPSMLPTYTIASGIPYVVNYYDGSQVYSCTFNIGSDRKTITPTITLASKAYFVVI